MSTILGPLHLGAFALAEIEKARIHTRGRPLKFGEPLVRREFRLPTSLSEKLNEVATGKNADVSDVVRDALREHFGEGEASEQSVKDAVKEAFEEMLGDNLVLSIGDTQREKLEAVAARAGLLSSTDLLKVMALKAINDPAFVESLLSGPVQNHFRAAAQEKLDQAKTPKKRANTKAA